MVYKDNSFVHHYFNFLLHPLGFEFSNPVGFHTLVIFPAGKFPSEICSFQKLRFFNGCTLWASSFRTPSGFTLLLFFRLANFLPEICSFQKLRFFHNAGLERLHPLGFEFSNPVGFHTLVILLRL